MPEYFGGDWNGLPKISSALALPRPVAARACSRRCWPNAPKGGEVSFVKFWDSSAVVPLLIAEAHTKALLALYQRDDTVIAWWGTEIECASALARLEREGHLPAKSVTPARLRLQALRRSWEEIQPVEAVREIARRLLRNHPLRAADALQLAAAWVASEHEPSSLEFVCLDERLSHVAEREGFQVVTF